MRNQRIGNMSTLVEPNSFDVSKHFLVRVAFKADRFGNGIYEVLRCTGPLLFRHLLEDRSLFPDLFKDLSVPLDGDETGRLTFLCGEIF
jgi:hypothetical protein